MFRSSLSQYLRYALLATAAVAVVPLLVVIAVALTARTQTSILTAGLIGAVLSLLAALGWAPLGGTVDPSLSTSHSASS